MQISVETIIETLGPCTEDIRDCEIMRAAIVLQGAALDNDRSQAIRIELAKVACSECINCFLRNVVIR